MLGIDQSQGAEEWTSKMHLACVPQHSNPPVPPPFVVPPLPFVKPPQDQSSLNSIAGDLHLLCDATEHQHLREISNEEEKKNSSNGWEKLPDKVQIMILCLLAVSDEVLPTGTADSYIKILKQTKAFGVAMVLNLGLSIRVVRQRSLLQWQTR